MGLNTIKMVAVGSERPDPILGPGARVARVAACSRFRRRVTLETHRVSARAVQERFQRQRGVCRVPRGPPTEVLIPVGAAPYRLPRVDGGMLCPCGVYNVMTAP